MLDETDEATLYCNARNLTGDREVGDALVRQILGSVIAPCLTLEDANRLLLHMVQERWSPETRAVNRALQRHLRRMVRRGRREEREERRARAAVTVRLG